MQALETASTLKIPLSKVPRSFERQLVFSYTQFSCDDCAKSRRIVAADAVEIDSKYKRLHRS